MAERRTQADIANLNSAGLYRFDRGLFLQVKGADAKSWIYRYTLDGTSRWMGLGSTRDVTLAKARERLTSSHRRRDRERSCPPAAALSSYPVSTP